MFDGFGSFSEVVHAFVVAVGCHVLVIFDFVVAGLDAIYRVI